MPGKNRILHSIDIPRAGAFDAGPDPSGIAALAPPAQASIGAPTNLQLTTSLERSASTATARIAATWYPPAGVAPSSYVIQWSTSNTFPDNATSGQGADTEATAFGGLIPNTLYYVRVLAIVANQTGAWSATVSITTDVDIIPPNPPTSVAWSWGASGDLDITWLDGGSANQKSVEIKVWNSAAKTTLYRTLEEATGTQRTIYTAAMNAADTSNVYDSAVYIELRAHSWGGIFSTTAATPTTQPSKAAPATPTGLTTSWASDPGTAGADCVITWTAQADAIGYRLTIDGIAREVAGANRYTYTFGNNHSEHSSTPDPVLTLSLVALDGLKQASTTPASATATNAAPAAPTVALGEGFSQVAASVSSAVPADFDTFEYVFKLGGVTQATLLSKGALYTYQVTTDGPGSWTVAIRVRDLFGQYSSATTSSAVVIDALSMAYLRADMVYTDDAGNTSAALNVLKDATLGSGGITYSA